MKKFLVLIINIAISIVVVYAQAPQAFNYTGIALDSKGKEIRNKNISVQAEINDTEGSSYMEIHEIRTNNNGLFSIKIGGKYLDVDPTGSITDIDWSAPTAKYLTVGISLDGGMSFEYMDPVQLLSVPYALHAETASSISGTDGYFANGGEAGEADRTLGNTDDYALGLITNGQTRLNITNEGNIGIGTSEPHRRFELVTDQDVSTITATTYRPSFFTAGFFNGRGARGSLEEPLPVQANDWLATYNGNGYGLTGFSTFSRARIGMRAAEDWTDDDQGTYMIFATTPEGSTDVTERMRITAEGRVGIGTEDPDVDFEVATYQATAQITATSYNPTGFTAGMFEGRGARGTQDDPQPVGEGDFLATYNGNGYAPRGFSNRSRARIAMRTAEEWTDDSQGAYMSFWTTPGGTTSRTEHMRISDQGDVGIGTTDPKSKLQVDGGVQFANDTDAANADKVGTVRYRADSNNSYLEMCMQTGSSSYAWISLRQISW